MYAGFVKDGMNNNLDSIFLKTLPMKNDLYIYILTFKCILLDSLI